MNGMLYMIHLNLVKPFLKSTKTEKHQFKTKQNKNSEQGLLYITKLNSHSVVNFIKPENQIGHIWA